MIAQPSYSYFTLSLSVFDLSKESNLMFELLREDNHSSTILRVVREGAFHFFAHRREVVE
jgi:hypothetical protein